MIFIILLILSEFYFIYNRKILLMKFSEKDVSMIRKTDLIYYFIKLSSFIYPFLLIIDNSVNNIDNLMYVLILIHLLNFLFYHLSKMLYFIYSLIYTYLKIVIYFILLFLY